MDDFVKFLWPALKQSTLGTAIFILFVVALLVLGFFAKIKDYGVIKENYNKFATDIKKQILWQEQ